MAFIFFACLLYFLPSIIARHKRSAGAIVLFNALFGWTGIGWLIALAWACAAEPQPVRVYAGGPAMFFCSRCGRPLYAGASFCASCGGRV
jgi:Superinfection immunity protein/zinc-ribbon domain